MSRAASSRPTLARAAAFARFGALGESFAGQPGANAAVVPPDFEAEARRVRLGLEIGRHDCS
eukprot:2251175-Lingulodinium_polyedra.AAC.1